MGFSMLIPLEFLHNLHTKSADMIMIMSSSTYSKLCHHCKPLCMQLKSKTELSLSDLSHHQLR